MENGNANDPGVQGNDTSQAAEQATPNTEAMILDDTTTATSTQRKPAGRKRLMLVLSGIIVLGVGGVGAYALLSKVGAKPAPSQSVSSKDEASSSSAKTAPSLSATVDPAIASDLKSADTSLNQSAADQKNSDSALDDSTQQVTVPTE